MSGLVSISESVPTRDCLGQDVPAILWLEGMLAFRGVSYWKVGGLVIFFGGF